MQFTATLPSELNQQIIWLSTEVLLNCIRSQKWQLLTESVVLLPCPALKWVKWCMNIDAYQYHWPILQVKKWNLVLEQFKQGWCNSNFAYVLDFFSTTVVSKALIWHPCSFQNVYYYYFYYYFWPCNSKRLIILYRTYLMWFNAPGRDSVLSLRSLHKMNIIVSVAHT